MVCLLSPDCKFPAVNCIMSSLDGKSTCDKCGNSGGKRVSASTSNKKECTSCEQNNCNDGASDTTGSNCNSDIDIVAEGISRVDISSVNNTGGSNNDGSLFMSDDKLLFADPPPNEDCPLCMLPMPFASGLCA